MQNICCNWFEEDMILNLDQKCEDIENVRRIFPTNNCITQRWCNEVQRRNKFASAAFANQCHCHIVLFPALPRVSVASRKRCSTVQDSATVRVWSKFDRRRGNVSPVSHCQLPAGLSILQRGPHSRFLSFLLDCKN